MNTDTDRITIVEHQYSYDLVTDDGTVLAAGIATRQDAEDRRRELLDTRPKRPTDAELAAAIDRGIADEDSQ